MGLFCRSKDPTTRHAPFQSIRMSHHPTPRALLTPAMRSLLDRIARAGHPPMHALSPAQAKAAYAAGAGVLDIPSHKLARVEDLHFPARDGFELKARLYAPASEEPLPVLLYFHGGGFTVGSVATHEPLCRHLAHLAHCAVVSVDYRLAPEWKFPTAVHDAWDSLAWLRENAAALRLNGSSIAVGGDSAGANLAAVVAIAARDAADLPIAFQLLIYPATDMRRGHASHGSNGRGYLLESTTIAYFHDHYIDDPRLDLDWRASPLLQQNLAGLPPALVLTAGFDPLRDEGLAYADALSAAGNRSTSICFERQIHGFITMGRVLEEANTAVNLCAAAVRHALEQGKCAT